MSVKRYKIGFRVDINGSLNHLWDSREVVMSAEYDELAAALREIARFTNVPSDSSAWSVFMMVPEEFRPTPAQRDAK